MKTTKKILALVLSVIMVMASVSVFVSAAEPVGEIFFTDATGTAGDTVDISLKVREDMQLYSTRVDFSFDEEKFELVSYEYTDALPGQSSKTPATTDRFFIWTNDALPTMQDVAADAALVNLKIKIKDGVEAGQYKITPSYDIDNEDIVNVDYEPLVVTMTAGTITVEASTPTPATYEVKFVVEGEQVGETQSVTELTAATAPAAPEKEPDDEYMYSFLGWSIDGTEEGIKNVAEYLIEADTTFTAVFEAVEIPPVVDPYEGVQEYAEEKYPDATAIYYLSYANGNDSNDGLTPETAKKMLDSVNSIVSAAEAGTYVYVLMDDYRMRNGDSTSGGANLNIKTANENTTVIVTSAKGHKARFAGTVSVQNGTKAKVIFDEVKVILGDNTAYASNAKQSWIAINGEINLNANGADVTVTEDFEIAEMSYSAGKKLLADGTEEECDPVQRTAGIGFHTTAESESGTYSDGPVKVLGGTWGYVRGTGSGAAAVTSNVVSEVGGEASVTTYALGGHNVAVMTGNLTGTVSGGYVKNAYMGSAANGAITGNAYMTISGGKVDTLNIGNNNASKLVSGDAIATITGGTIGAIVDKGNVSGNTVLFLNEGYELNVTVPETIDYVIKAPAEGGTVELALDANGAFAGFTATPATEGHVVKVNGLDATPDANGVYSAAKSTEITFGEPVTGHVVLFNDMDGNKVASFEVEDGATFDKSLVPALSTDILDRVEEGLVKASGWDENLAKLDAPITEDVTITMVTDVEPWPVLTRKFDFAIMDNGEKLMKADMTGFTNNSHRTGARGTDLGEVNFLGYTAKKFLPGVNPNAGKEYYPASAYTKGDDGLYTLNEGATKNVAADLYDAVNNSTIDANADFLFEGYATVPKNNSVDGTTTTDYNLYDNITVKYYIDVPADKTLGEQKSTIALLQSASGQRADSPALETGKWAYAKISFEDYNFTKTSQTIQYHLYLGKIVDLYNAGATVYVSNILWSADELATYDVTFKGDTDYVVEVLEDEAAVFAGTVTVPEGKILKGWALTEGGEAIEGDITVAEDTTLYPVFVEPETKVVYLSSTGSDANDGLTKDTAKGTLKGAVALAGAGHNTVVLVVDDTSATAGNMNNNPTLAVGNLTITSKWGDEDYTATGKLPLPNGYWNSSADQSKVSGFVTIENITIYVTDSQQWSFINLNGFEVYWGEGIVVDSSKPDTYNLKVRMGGEQGNVDYDMYSGPIVIDSGRFGAFHLGSKGTCTINNINFIWNNLEKASINVGNDGDGDKKATLTGYTRLEINAPVSGVSMSNVATNNADYAVIFNNGVAPVTPTVVANTAKKVFQIHAGEGFILHNTDEVGVFEVEAYPEDAAYLFLNGKAWTPAETITLTESGTYKLTSADYKVEFKQGETVLETDYISAGEFAAFDGTTPVDGEKVFTGWAVEGTEDVVDLTTYTVTADTVFVPVFVEKFVVKFMNGDVQVGETIEVLPDADEATRTITAPDAVEYTGEEIKYFKNWVAGDVEVDAGESYVITGSVEFTANFVDALVVTFEGAENGTFVLNPLAEEADRTITAPAALADTETTFFKNWIAGETEVEAGADYVVAESITFTANFVDGIVVNFYNGEDVVETFYVNPLLETKTVEAPAAVDYTGTDAVKVFTGWATEDGALTIGANGTVAVTENTDFYAQFADKFIVKFMNGDVQVGETFEVDPTADNKKITAPEAVDYTGEEVKYFVDWIAGDVHLDANAEYEVTGSITFTANFVDAYEVKFFNEDEQVGETLYFNPLAPEALATAPDAVEYTGEGSKVFTGWVAGELVVAAGQTFNVDASIDFYAQFADKFIVKFMNGDVQVGETIEVDPTADNKTITAPEAVEYTGEEVKFFKNWVAGEVELDALATYDVTGSITFEANFVDAYVVKFMNGDVQVGDTKYINPEAPEYVQMPEAVESAEAHKIFVGWTDGENTYNAGDLCGVTASVTYTAVFEDEPTYTATFYVDTEAYGEPQKLYKGDEVTFPVKAPEKENYTFNGWYVSGDATETIVDAYEMVGADVSFVAKFTENDKVDITIGGVTENVYVGEVITLPETATIPEGMVRFLGWATAQGATAAEYAAGAQYTVGDTSVALYPVFSASAAWYHAVTTHTVHKNEYKVELYIEGDKVNSTAFGIGYDPTVLDLKDAVLGEKFIKFETDNNILTTDADGFYGDAVISKNFVTEQYIDATVEGGVLVATLTFDIIDTDAFDAYETWTDIISTPENEQFIENLGDGAKDYYNNGYCYIAQNKDEDNPLGIIFTPIALEAAEEVVITKVINVVGTFTASDRHEAANDANIKKATLTVYDGDTVIGEVEIDETAASATTAYAVELAPGEYTFVFEKTGYLTVSKTVEVDPEDALESGDDQDIGDTAAEAGDVYDSIKMAKDEIVDIADFIRVMRGFDAEVAANADYLKEADLDEDGQIKVDDLDIIKNNFSHKGYGYKG